MTQDRAPLLLETSREVLEGLPETGPAAGHYIAFVPDLGVRAAKPTPMANPLIGPTH